MFSVSTRQVERPFLDLKVLRYRANMAADSRDAAGEKGVDRLHHSSAPLEVTALRVTKPSELFRKISMVYFSCPWRNDRANHGLEDEPTTDGVMA
jgi:hypothetical protein